MSSVFKATIELIKLSLMMICRMTFQSVAVSPNKRQIASRASFTTGGGLPMDRISTKSLRLMPFTAVHQTVKFEEQQR